MVKSKATEEVALIEQHHAAYKRHYKVAFEEAAEAGRLLFRIRRSLRGSKVTFQQWIRSNLTFSESTAQKYMKCWEIKSVKRPKEAFTTMAEALGSVGLIPRKLDSYTKWQRMMLRAHEILKHSADPKLAIEAMPYAVLGRSEIPVRLAPYVTEWVRAYAFTPVIK